MDDKILYVFEEDAGPPGKLGAAVSPGAELVVLELIPPRRNAENRPRHPQKALPWSCPSIPVVEAALQTSMRTFPLRLPPLLLLLLWWYKALTPFKTLANGTEEEDTLTAAAVAAAAAVALRGMSTPLFFIIKRLAAINCGPPGGGATKGLCVVV